MVLENEDGVSVAGEGTGYTPGHVVGGGERGAPMLGLLVLICMYLVLGFLLAWVAQLVAREEVEVKTGVLILVITAIVSIAAGLILGQTAPSLAPVGLPALQFGMLVVLTKQLAGLTWKHSLIIAVIYTVLLFLLRLALGALLS